MKRGFNYLQNLDAVNEILKHKWIESQKEKRDIGFATAAVDWIRKYGEEWKRAQRIDDAANKNLEELAERRKYRRFKIDLPVKINTGTIELDAQIKELNYVGVNLICKASPAIGSDIDIAMHPASKEKRAFDIRFKSKVVKSRLYKNPDSQSTEYLITALFDKNTQSLILNNKKELLN